MHEPNANALLLHNRDSGQEIAVSRDEGSVSHLVFGRQQCYVEPNHQVHTLLLKDRFGSALTAVHQPPLADSVSRQSSQRREELPLLAESERLALAWRVAGQTVVMCGANGSCVLALMTCNTLSLSFS